MYKKGGDIVSKKPISRETCQKELLRMAKADVLASTVLFLVMLLIFVPLVLMAIYVSKYVLALGIVFALLCAIWPLVLLYKLIACIYKLYLIKQNGFSIVKDKVYSLSKGEVITRHSTADVIYFTDHGRYVPPKTVFELASVGDEFYLVILTSKNKELVLAYHTAMYALN